MNNPEVRRKLFAFGFWLVATAAAGAVALGAVALAAGQVANTPVRPLTAAEVNALPVDVSSNAGSETTSGPGSGPAVETIDAAPVLETIDDPDLASSATTAPTTSSTTSVPQSSTPTTLVASTTTTVLPETTTTTVTTLEGEQRTFNLIGGSVSVILGDGILELVWAVPNSGFQMDEVEVAEKELKVEFESSSHESELKIEWEGDHWDIDEKEEEKSEDD